MTVLIVKRYNNDRARIFFRKRKVYEEKWSAGIRRKAFVIISFIIIYIYGHCLESHGNEQKRSERSKKNIIWLIAYMYVCIIIV